MSINFSSLSRTQSQQSVGSDDSVSMSEPKNTGPVISKADGAAVTAQQNVMKALKKPLTGRNITADNLISKQGVQTLLGKASRHANVKDAFLRFGYRLLNRMAPDASGSHFKAAMRLADRYHDLQTNGGSNEDKLNTLLQLREKLNAHEFPESSASSLKQLLNFVDAEISFQPGAHLEEAFRLKDQYDQLPEYYATMPSMLLTNTVRFEKLEDINRHLEAAEMGGLTDPRLQLLKTSVEEELLVVTPKYEMEKAIAEKASPGQLKPTRTQVHDTVLSDMRAGYQHDQFMEQVKSDKLSYLTHMVTGMQIDHFDRSKLNHVTPKEIHDTTGGELQRAKMNHDLNSFVDDLVSSMPTPKVSPPSVHQEPTLETLTAHTLTADEFHEMGARLNAALTSGNKEALKELATQLGNLMGADLRTAPREVQLSVASSSGDQLKHDLLLLLVSQIPKREGEALRANHSKELRAFLDEAYNHAATQLSDHQVDENTVVIQGEAYTKQRRLGAGGNGYVDLYENAAGRQIVLKSPLLISRPNPEDRVKELQEKFKEACHEAQSHRHAMGGGHPNVVQLEGLVRTADGSLLLALELAPRGDADTLIQNLDRALKEGLITPFAANSARITILKDMIDGMAHVNDVRNINHYDLKPVNFFVGGDGQILLGDFGTARTGSEHDVSESPVDSPVWLAPEIIIGRMRKRTSPELEWIEDRYNLVEQTELAAIDEATKDLPEDERENARNDVQESVKQRKKEAEDHLTFEATRKADVWAMGVSAHQLLLGGLPFDGDFTVHIERAVAEFGNAGELFHGLGLDRSGNETGMGLTSVDRIINQMLHPDPTERPDFSVLAQHSLFSEPGVGEKETRDLIKALTEPVFDAAKIKEASDALGEY